MTRAEAQRPRRAPQELHPCGCSASPAARPARSPPSSRRGAAARDAAPPRPTPSPAWSPASMPSAASRCSPPPRRARSRGAMSRVCAWCRTVPWSTPRARFCSRRCRQTAFRLRRQRIEGDASLMPTAGRFAYADPALPGLSARYYGREPTFAGEVDHRALIASLEASSYAGWALSTSARSPRDVLPLPPTARGAPGRSPSGAPADPGHPLDLGAGDRRRRRQRPRACGTGLAMPARGGGETSWGASRWPSAHGSSTSWGCSPATSSWTSSPGPGGHPAWTELSSEIPTTRRPLQEVTSSLGADGDASPGPRGGRVARVPARRWLPSVAHAVGESSCGFPTTPRGPRDPRLHPGRRARVADARAVGAAGGDQSAPGGACCEGAPAASSWRPRRTATGRGSPSSRRAAPHADAQRTAPDAPAEGGASAPRARGRAPRARGDHSPPAPPWRVVIVRPGPWRWTSDAAWTSAKSVRDEIAAWCGVDDGDAATTGRSGARSPGLRGADHDRGRRDGRRA